LAIDRGGGLLTAALAFSRLSNYCSWQDNGSKKALITGHDWERKAIQDFVRFKEGTIPYIPKHGMGYRHKSQFFVRSWYSEVHK